MPLLEKALSSIINQSIKILGQISIKIFINFTTKGNFHIIYLLNRK